MLPRLTDEMRAALASNRGGPIEVEDGETHQVYLLVDAEQGQRLMRRWLTDALKRGMDDVHQGRVVPFDPEAIKAQGRNRVDAG